MVVRATPAGKQNPALCVLSNAKGIWECRHLISSILEGVSQSCIFKSCVHVQAQGTAVGRKFPSVRGLLIQWRTAPGFMGWMRGISPWRETPRPGHGKQEVRSYSEVKGWGVENEKSVSPCVLNYTHKVHLYTTHHEHCQPDRCSSLQLPCATSSVGKPAVCAVTRCVTVGDSRGFGRDSPVELYQLHEQLLDALLMVTACACSCWLHELGSERLVLT